MDQATRNRLLALQRRRDELEAELGEVRDAIRAAVKRQSMSEAARVLGVSRQAVSAMMRRGSGQRSERT